jgi:hypothetical protein
MPKGKSPSQARNQNRTPWDTIRNSVNQAYNIVGDAFKDLGKGLARTPEVRAIQGVSSTTSQYVPPGLAQQQYYQVKKNDKDIMDVSNKTGVPAQQIVDINKTKTLPPAGSYIQLVNQGVPPSVASQIARSVSPANTSAANRGDPAAQNLRNQANQITQQLAAGQLPDSIPSAVVGFIRDNQGKPLTLQDLVAEGYTMNAQGVMVRNAAGQVTTSVGSGSAEFMNTGFMRNYAAKGVDFLNQKRYYKGKYVKIGDLIRRGILDVKTGRVYDSPKKRNKKGKLVDKKPAKKAQAPAPAPAPAQPTNTEGPTTILDIHLGSG